MALPMGHIAPASFALTALVALTAHVPQLLTTELRRRTLRPLALCAIGMYGLFCMAIVAIAFAVGA